MFRSFFRWIGLRLGLMKAGIDEVNEGLLKNPALLRQEGENAKKELTDRYKEQNGAIVSRAELKAQKEIRVGKNAKRLETLTNALAGKIKVQGNTPDESLGFQISKLMTGVENAKKKMLDRAKQVGITDVRDPGITDAEFKNHYAAFTKMSGQLKDLVAECEGKIKDVQDSLNVDRDGIRKDEEVLRSAKKTLEATRRQIAELPGKVEDVINDILGAEAARKSDQILADMDKPNESLALIERMGSKARAQMAAVGEVQSPTFVDDQYLTDDPGIDDEINALLNPTAGVKSDDKTTDATLNEYLPNG